MRSNTICFPQAQVHELITKELPAAHEDSTKFLSETISIALAGCNKDDLDRATWAEVPREAYMTAVRFCVAHSEAYAELTINEERGRELFAEIGESCQAVRD